MNLTDPCKYKAIISLIKPLLRVIFFFFFFFSHVCGEGKILSNSSLSQQHAALCSTPPYKAACTSWVAQAPRAPFLMCPGDPISETLEANLCFPWALWGRLPPFPGAQGSFGNLSRGRGVKLKSATLEASTGEPSLFRNRWDLCLNFSSKTSKSPSEEASPYH